MYKYLSMLMVLVMVAVGVAGCGRLRSGAGATPTATADDTALLEGTYDRTMTVDGRVRAYRLHGPAAAAGRTGLPVVLLLHGFGQSAREIEENTHMDAVADRNGFVAVYPSGAAIGGGNPGWNAGRCCGAAASNNVDDVKFMNSLIDTLTRLGADPNRIYVTGFSNGAMMALRLGCELSGRIAGIAPVAGSIRVDTCQPGRPLPVLSMHGTADTAVPYDSETRTISTWTRTDQCPQTPVETREGAVTRTTYGPCAHGYEVTLYTIADGGHVWPGGANGLARNAAEPDASAVIWEFFSRYPLS